MLKKAPHSSMIPNLLNQAENETSISMRDRVRCYLHLWFIDHGILRSLYENRHLIGDGFYRTNQPSPRKIRKYKGKFKIRTIVNLRGDNPTSPWQKLEAEVCKNESIKLICVRVLSRDAPKKETFQELKEIIDTIELPAMAHCKSGADRGGLFAVLYRHFRLGHPIEEAMSELHWAYGHFKSSKTGILDFVFESYLKERNEGQSFMNWIENDYDRAKIREQFRPKRWSNFFVDLILRRE